MKKNIVIVTGLLTAALLWVAVLSVIVGGGSAQTGKAAADGSKAIIKDVDESSFHRKGSAEITLRMDILGPDNKPLLGLTREMVKVLEEDAPGKVVEFNGPGTNPINAILVIDVSGSMRQQDREGTSRIVGAKQAALTAVEELKVRRDRIGIIAFDDRYEVVQPLERLTDESKLKCQQAIGALGPRGGTVIGVPTLAALQIFEQQSPNGQNVIMVMTDGEDDALDGFVNAIAAKSQATGVPVFTIGFGEDVGSENTLKMLASNCKGKYYEPKTAGDLAEIYRSRIKELTNEFTLRYQSPYPDADGLDRKVEVTIDAPPGTVTATSKYKIGGILAGGSRSAAKNFGKAETTAGSVFARVALFFVLGVLLLGGLFAPTLLGLGRGKSDGTASATPPSMNQMSGGRVTAPPPPGRSAAATRTTAVPATNTANPAVPSASKPTHSAPPSLPKVTPAAQPKVNKEQAVAPPPPSPQVKKPASPRKPLPLGGETGQKQSIRPVAPPPPPKKSDS